MLGEHAAQIAGDTFKSFFEKSSLEAWNQGNKFVMSEKLLLEAFADVDKKIRSFYTQVPANYEWISSSKKENFLLERSPQGDIYYSTKTEKRPIDFGTTAAVMILLGKKLFVGNVGDSQASISKEVRENLISENLTVMHNSKNDDEVKRIQSFPDASFGKDGYLRVVDKQHCCEHHVAMSRALGHMLLCKYGVISEPTISTRTLTKADRFIILATDGVWDVLQDTEAHNLIAEFEDPKEAAQALVNNAVELANIADNTTAIVVFL